MVGSVSSPRLSLRKFYIRRAFRILPPAVFYLLVITVLGLIGVIPFALDTVLSHSSLCATMLSWIIRTGDMVLGAFLVAFVEEHFYLIWPTIFVLAG